MTQPQPPQAVNEPCDVEPRKVRIDLDTQMREEEDFDIIEEYAEKMEAGVIFPPISVIYVDELDEFVLTDGFQRLRAHCRVRPDQKIPALVTEGTVELARWVATAANQDHGVRRKPDDKAKAVKAALLHPMGAKMSDRRIAEHVGVDHKTVARYRSELQSTGEIPQLPREGADGKTRKPPANKPGPEPAGEVERVCNECGKFDDNRAFCYLKNMLQPGYTEACEEFEPKRSPVVKKLMGPRPVHPQVKKVGRAEIYLPFDNHEEFAAELYHRFDFVYLRKVYQVIERMEADPDVAV